MGKGLKCLFAFGITLVLALGALAWYSDAHAACRMRPQCSTDADCASICGGSGHCVHSNCPIRVCKCG